MSAERRQILLVTLVVIAIFGTYEIAKSLMFPTMESNTSHVISTCIVGLLTLIAARYVIFYQSDLLKERERGNERLHETLAQAERSENLLRSIVESVAEGLVITDRESQILLVNERRLPTRSWSLLSHCGLQRLKSDRQLIFGLQ